MRTVNVTKSSERRGSDEAQQSNEPHTATYVVDYGHEDGTIAN